jgi:hypothetical protein
MYAEICHIPQIICKWLVPRSKSHVQSFLTLHVIAPFGGMCGMCGMFCSPHLRLLPHLSLHTYHVPPKTHPHFRPNQHFPAGSSALTGAWQPHPAQMRASRWYTAQPAQARRRAVHTRRSTTPPKATDSAAFAKETGSLPPLRHTTPNHCRQAASFIPIIFIGPTLTPCAGQRNPNRSFAF